MKHKSMRTFKISIIVALALLLGLTQCKKKIVEPTTGGEMITVTISAGLGGGNSKTGITEAGKVTWTVGDKIYYGKDASNISVAEVTAVGPNANNVAGKVATFTVTVENGVKYHFYYCGENVPTKDNATISFAEQVATSTVADNLADIATKYHINYGTATLKEGSSGVTTIGMNNIMSIGKFDFNTAVDGKQFTTNEDVVMCGLPNAIQLTFGNDIFKVGSMITEDEPEIPSKEQSTVTYFQEGAKGKVYLRGAGGNDAKYVALVPASTNDEEANDEMKIFFGGIGAGSIEASNTKGVVSMTQGVVKNKLYVNEGNASIPMEKPALRPFSISETETVYFAPGNIYYDPEASTTSKWYFEKNQYDYRTYYAGKKTTSTGSDYKPSVINGVYGETSTPDSDWGLFGWSTDAANNNWGLHTEISAVAGITDGNFNDWGKNGINYNGKMTSDTYGWFTMSREQWSYLLGKRTNYMEKSGEATITVTNGTVSGLVILPDEFTLPDGVSFVSKSDSKSYKFDSKSLLQTIEGMQYSDNSYTVDQWNAMAEAGAVFLPVTSMRVGVVVSELNGFAYYWINGIYSGLPAQARMLTFHNNYLSNNATNLRCAGLAVRLVHY